MAIVEAFDFILDHPLLFPDTDAEELAFRKHFSLEHIKSLADATLARTVIQEFSSARPSKLALKAMCGAELDPADIPSKVGHPGNLPYRIVSHGSLTFSRLYASSRHQRLTI